MQDRTSGGLLPAPILDDGVVRLRPWHADDGACVRAGSRDVRVLETTTVPEDPTDEALAAFIAHQHVRLRERSGWSLAIAEMATDRAMGCVTLLLRPQARVAGLGYWVAPASRGEGAASRAASLLSTWGLTGARFGRVEAWVEPGNDASVQVLGNAGFLFEGRLRSFLSFPDRRTDALVFSRVRDDLP